MCGGRLTIDRDAIAANWAYLGGRLTAGTECAATIKADAYGTGAAGTAKRLAEAGCKTFFVALPAEGVEVRKVLPDAVIYILGGLFPGCAETYASANLRPMIGSAPELAEWSAFCKAHGQALETGLHVDTGMNRLGFRPDEFSSLLRDRDLTGPITASLLITHLACGSDPDHPANRRQLEIFRGATDPFKHIPRSMANSAGVFLGPEYHFDLARPGISLYGGKAIDTQPNPMRPVAMIEARVMQVRTVPSGETVGYGCTETAKERPRRVAMVAAGYADGLHRRASSSDERPGGFAWASGHRLPLIGRISMDMLALDITNTPEGLIERGSFVEMLGPNVAASDLAAYAETIDYEYLTGLGRRYHRRYQALPDADPAAHAAVLA
nr:alanine racemase [Roseibium litorale]